MFRRSRFSVRPNVSTAGRTAATPQEAPSSSQEASETPRDVSESATGPVVTDDKSVAEKSTGPGDGSDQNGDGSSSSAAVQRRKRFSVKPKVAPGRPTTLARTPKSPVKSVSETPVGASGSDFDKPTKSSQSGPTAAFQGLESPKQRRASEVVKQAKVQPKPTPSDSSAHSTASPTEDSLEQTHLPADSKQLESTSCNQVKEAPSRVPPFIPDKEAIELSEKAKTLVSSKSGLSLSPSALSLSRLLNDPSDLHRLAKAQKLKQLLREERHKEKKLKKPKARAKEYTLDPAKMTMRDLIRYLPLSNPMSSTLEHSTQENDTVVPTSPGREDRSPERAQEPEVLPKIVNPEEEENEEADEEQDEGLMVPQVKVAEDGSLIIDEESLTVEVQRAKGPNPAQDRDPIFERGSTTTYSSFRKGTSSKPWFSEETDMFFLAISMVGTDFSMICQLFPHRARAEIKNKFKKEERENAWRIDKAFRERRKLDIEYFSKLLEKILEVQKNRKKLKSLAEKNSPKKQRKRKAKGKKAARKLSDVEEDEEDESHPEMEDEEEGEKENELLCNEGETTASKPKKQRTSGKDASIKEPSNKKYKKGDESSEQGEPCIPEDAEAALPENPTNSDMSEKTENVSAKDTAVKPAKLSRCRAPKPLLPLGRKWGKKVPPQTTKAKDGANEDVSDGASKQVNKDASPSRLSANDEISSEEEEAAVPPPRPTRYGRVPKPTKLLTYPCEDDEHSSASETTPSSPVQYTASADKPKPKCTAKRGRSSMPQSDQESKRPKLVTLRASQSDYSDEENEPQWEQDEVEQEQHLASSPSKDSIAPAFVPASLRSPHSKISVVEETMEELDILANMPDVLGISQDALCPDASCEQAQNETGIAEPCEHQLDLLVDVIDFLSSEQTEVSEDESYNEAAQTLLTIGNLTHLFQAPQNQIATQDHVTGIISENETSQQQEGEIPSNPATHEQSAAPCESAASGNGVTETSEAAATVELQTSKADGVDSGQICNEQWTGSDMNHTPQLQSSPESLKKNSPQTRRRNLSVLKPQLSRPSRNAQVKSQPETSPIIKSVTESVPEEATPECTPPSPKDISCAEIKLTEEPSGSQERARNKMESGAVNQSHCFSDVQLEPSLQPSLEHANRETEPISASKDEKLMSQAEIIENGSNDLTASDLSVTEPQVEQGSTTDSVEGQEDSPHSAVLVTLPAEDLPGNRKAECEVASTSQSRKSRLPKVKPKPNLLQTCRTVRSKPHVTKDSIEKDCSSIPIPETIAEVKPEQSCATPPGKSTELTGPSDFTPSLDVGCTLTPTEELSTAQEKNADVGLFGHVDSGATTLGESYSENQNFSEDKCQPSMKQARTLSGSVSTNEKPMSHAEIIDSPFNLATCEISITEGSKTDSVLVQEGNQHCVGFVKPVEDLPASPKAETEVASSCQSGRSRLQKVKPKPNLPQTRRTARSNPQTTKDSIEKHFSTTLDVEPERTCATPAETTTQSTVPASDLTSSFDLGSVPIPTEEFSTTEVKNTDVGCSGEVDSSTAISGQSVSKNQDFSRVQVHFQPSEEQGSRVTRPESIECRSSSPVTSKSAVTELEVEQGSTTNSASKLEYSDNTVAEVKAQPTCSTIFPHKSSQSVGTTSVSELSVELCTNDKPTEEHKSDVGFGLDTSSESSEQNVPQRRCRSLKVKPKPNLASSTRTTRSNLHPKGFSKTSEQHDMDMTSNVKREQQCADKNGAQTEPEKDGNKSSMPSSSNADSTKCAAAETSLDSTNDKSICSGGTILVTSSVAENWSVLTDSVPKNESGEKSTGDKMSSNSEMEVDPSLIGNCKVDETTRVAESKTKPTGDSAAFLNVQCSEDGSTESKINSALTTEAYSIADPNESCHQSCPKSDSDDKSQGAVQQCSETSENIQTSNSSQSLHSPDKSQSELADTPASLRKAPPTRRGRLIKPRPNLGRSSQNLKQQQVPNITPAEADSGACSKGVDASVPQKSVPELTPDKEPVEGAVEQPKSQDSDPHYAVSSLDCMKHAVEQHSQHDAPSHDAGSSLGCLPQVPSTQNASTSSLEGTQGDSCLTLLSDILSEQVPSDPDEPFFILSLTEIPVCSSGEAVDSAAEPLSYLPVTDASIPQQSSFPGECVGAVAGDGSLSDAPVLMSTEESGEMNLVNVNDTGLDPNTHVDLIMNNPVDTHEMTTVQSPKTVENNSDTEIPPSKQRLRGTGREAKVQVRPTRARTKQASKTLATNTIQDPHHLGPSVQPETCDAAAKTGEVVTEPQKRGGDQVDIEKETLTSAKDSSSGAPTRITKTRVASSGSSVPPPGKAVSTSFKAKTPHSAGKRSSATPHNVAPTPSSTQPPGKAHSTLSTTSPTETVMDIEQNAEHSRQCSDPTTGTSHSTAEVSAPQQGDCVESSSTEEEPTSVSQYFLSDIFTEVEEG